MSKKLEFLKKYKQLCKDYKLEIKGCGDCGSAWLSEIEDTTKPVVYCGDFEEIHFADEYDLKMIKEDNYKGLVSL